jgi:hypothetical protein
MLMELLRSDYKKGGSMEKKQRGRPPGKVKDPRRCQLCKIDKPLIEFTTAPSLPGGRTYNCRSCERDKQLLRDTFRKYRKSSLDEMFFDVAHASHILDVKMKVFNIVALEKTNENLGGSRNNRSSYQGQERACSSSAPENK